MEFVPDRFKTPETCDRAIDRCFLVFDSILDQYKPQVICDRVVSEDPFLIVYCPIDTKLKECVMKLLMTL